MECGCCILCTALLVGHTGGGNACLWGQPGDVAARFDTFLLLTRGIALSCCMHALRLDHPCFHLLELCHQFSWLDVQLRDEPDQATLLPANCQVDVVARRKQKQQAPNDARLSIHTGQRTRDSPPSCARSPLPRGACACIAAHMALTTLHCITLRLPLSTNTADAHAMATCPSTIGSSNTSMRWGCAVQQCSRVALARNAVMPRGTSHAPRDKLSSSSCCEAIAQGSEHSPPAAMCTQHHVIFTKQRRLQACGRGTFAHASHATRYSRHTRSRTTRTTTRTPARWAQMAPRHPLAQPCITPPQLRVVSRREHTGARWSALSRSQ